MRIIFYILLAVSIYYLLKSIFKSNPSVKKTTSNSLWQIQDELVKDPMCGVYIPKKKAMVAKIKGKVYYFCSKKCMEEYKKQLEEKK